MSDAALDQVVELALKLSDEEQEILLARVAAHRAHKGEPPLPEANQPAPVSDSQTWGEHLVALVRSFDLTETGLGWDDEDPEIWVRNHRRTGQRNPGWGSE